MRHTSSIDPPRLIIFLSPFNEVKERMERGPGGLLTGSTFPWKQKEWRVNIPMSHLQQAGLSHCRVEVFLSHTYTHMHLYAHTRVHTWLPKLWSYFLVLEFMTTFLTIRGTNVLIEKISQVRDCPQHERVLSADPEVRCLVLAFSGSVPNYALLPVRDGR